MNSKESMKKDMTTEEGIRINKYLALCGIASRRESDRLVEAGEVMINGRIARTQGVKVHPGKDEVVVKGRILALPEEKKVYILLNKPRNIITTNRDEKDRETVLDIVSVPQRIFPVGRLDRKSTGLLLLTNDGDLAHRLMHPSSLVEKEYLAQLEKPFLEKELKNLTGGMRLKDTGEKVSSCKAKILSDGMQVLVTIHEGKNHQVRRMFWSLGYDVKKLDRVSYAGLKVGRLRRGEWRFLNKKEVKELYQKCGSS